MAEFKIEINNFLGKNLKADPLDLNQHEAQTLDSFEVSIKPGALIKRKGYTDQANVILPAAYPSDWTINNIFIFTVNKPSIKAVFMVHATVDEENRIYVNYTASGDTWTEGWVELTENEEELTMDAGSNTTTIVDSALSSSTNDYYNGWYLFNWTRFKGAIITDYVGASKTITVLPAIASQTTGDSYSIWRFPMVVNFEGGTAAYTMDTGSSTTQAIDIDSPNTEFYELNQDFDDAYVNWTLFNTTRSDTEKTITAYEAFYANNRQRLQHAAITNQTDGDSYWLYKKTRTLSVENKIYFRQRPNICIMSLGSGYRFPKQFPLWYGFLRETYYFGSTSNKIEDGYYLEPQTLDAPHDEIFTCDTQGSGDLDQVDTFFIACAYQYDGYQIGPMTSIKRSYDQAVTTATDEDVRVTLNVGYGAAPNMRHSSVLNKRVTGIVIYAATDLDTGSKTATWYRMTTIPIREDYEISSHYHSDLRRVAREQEPFGSRRTFSKRQSILPGGRTDRTSGRERSIRAWTGTDPYARTFDIDAAAWANKSTYYTLDSGGMGGDKINYSYADDSMHHSIAVNLFLDKQEPSLMASSPLKDDGTPSPDYYPLLNLIDLASHGIYSIYNVKIINEYIYILGSTKSIRMLMNSNLVPSFKLDTEYEGIGTYATYSIEKYKNKIFGVFNNGIYLLDGREELISYPIEDIDNYPIGVTDYSEAYAKYYPLGKMFMIVFPTDNKMYTFSVINGQWAIHSLGDSIKALTVGNDGEIYGADDSKIYKLDNGTTDDGTSINPQWKSKAYSLGSQEGTLNYMELSYKSNTVIEFNVYINRSSTAASWSVSTDNQFASSTTATTVKKKFPHGFRGSQFEFAITIPSASRASNIYVEIYGLNIVGTAEERI